MDTIAWLITQILYDGAFTVFTVLLERGYDNSLKNSFRWTEEQKRVAEERAGASFMVVYEGEAIMDRVPLANIQYFVFPEAVYNEYVSTEGTPPKSLIPIISVPSNITRKVRGGSGIRVPNYELALDKIRANANKILRVHGVRLPTKEDLEHAKAYVKK